MILLVWALLFRATQKCLPFLNLTLKALPKLFEVVVHVNIETEGTRNVENDKDIIFATI